MSHCCLISVHEKHGAWSLNMSGDMPFSLVFFPFSHFKYFFLHICLTLFRFIMQWHNWWSNWILTASIPSARMSQLSISKYVHRPGQHCNIHGIFSNPNFPLSKLPVLKLDLLRLCFSGHLQLRKAWQSFVNSTFHCLNYLPSLLIPSCARITC